MEGVIGEALISELQAVAGDRLATGSGVREQHSRGEGSAPAHLPDAVVFPTSTDEVARVVSACARHGTPIVPFGAGSSLEGHVAAVRGGVCISFAQMTCILEVNATDLDCTVEAGVTREALNAHLRDTGLFFPIDPGADATIGGMASTRASGTNAVRYGTMRENVLRLKVVLPDGRVIVTATRARKSAAGYDLTRLFVGSEGSLGVITEVSLKLYGVPEAIASATCSFASLDQAVTAAAEAIQFGIPVARVELLDANQIAACNRYSNLTLSEQPTLFFEFHGSQAGVAEQSAAAGELARANGGADFQWSTSPEARSRLWKARHNAYFAALALKPGCVPLISDVCVPMSRLAETVTATREDIERAGLTATILGHVGDGNFHVIFLLDPSDQGEAARAEHVNEAMVDRALEAGGTCTGEHGIGLGKRHKLVRELGADAVGLMAALKHAVDPAGIMNPGKIFIDADAAA